MNIPTWMAHRHFNCNMFKTGLMTFPHRPTLILLKYYHLSNSILLLNSCSNQNLPVSLHALHSFNINLSAYPVGFKTKQIRIQAILTTSTDISLPQVVISYLIYHSNWSSYLGLCFPSVSSKAATRMMYLKFYSDCHFSAHYPSRASQLLRVKVTAMGYNVFHDLVQHLLYNLISSYLLIYSSNPKMLAFSFYPLNAPGIKLPVSLVPCALSKPLKLLHLL